MLPGSLNLGLARGHGGSALGGSLAEQVTCIVDWFQPPWGGLVVGCCCQKKGEASPKIQSPEFLGNKRLKITKKKSNYSDVGPGKLDEIAAR